MRRLLCGRCKRSPASLAAARVPVAATPRSRAAEQREELAPPHVGPPPPESVSRTFSLPQGDRQVLWAGLNRSESSESGCCGTRHSSARFTPQKSASPRVYVLPQYPKTAPHDGRTGEERLAILFPNGAAAVMCLSLPTRRSP